MSDNTLNTHALLDAGLGNQLFMIANSYAYSLRFKTKFSISLDWIGLSKSRPSYWGNLLKNLNKYVVDKRKIGKVIKEKDFSYKEHINYNENVTFKGFYQSEKYFKDYKKEVLELLKIPNDLIEFSTKTFNSWNIKPEDITVAIHIRRGDYLKKGAFFYIQPLEYYEKSKKYIEDRLGFRPRYVYFSNDMKWIEDNFEIMENDILVKGYKDYEDFVLMSRCNHYITANSSFSWWSAYIGSNTRKNSIVITPSIWFGPAGPKFYNSIFPSGWIVINSSNPKLSDVYFMGVITCNKYKNRIKEQDLSKNFMEYKYFIGDSSLKEDEFRNDEENNIIYVPCPDNYESLPKKVYLMMKWVYMNKPNVKYIVKADDDVFFNFDMFEEYCRYVANNDIDYAGEAVNHKSYISKSHFGKCEDEILSKTPINVPSSHFCGGPCYIVSRKAVRLILENFLKECNIYEDQSIGHYLNKRNIFPFKLGLRNGACKWI